METGKTERFTKEIIAGSRLEITQPDFNNMVMQKIFLSERNKAMKRALLCWFLGLSSLGIIIFLAVLSIYQTNSSPMDAMESFFQKAAQLVNGNLFIILSLAAFYVLYKMFNRKKSAYYLPDLNFELS
jgi:ABC-type sulfate transport system permease component